MSYGVRRSFLELALWWLGVSYTKFDGCSMHQGFIRSVAPVDGFQIESFAFKGQQLKRGRHIFLHWQGKAVLKRNKPGDSRHSSGLLTHARLATQKPSGATHLTAPKEQLLERCTVADPPLIRANFGQRRQVVAHLCVEAKPWVGQPKFFRLTASTGLSTEKQGQNNS